MLARHTQWCRCFARKRFFSSGSGHPHVAVVGGGPGGFYAAQHILKGHPSVTVDIYEKLPVPFGLVRFGVAPDHPEVKNVINTFTQTALNKRCNFLGNVAIGDDISIEQLRQSYTAVVLAYGADADKTFGIPGEDLDGVLSARSFVGWYNGLPRCNHLKVDLTSTDTAVVFGQGNVALDVARILLTPIDILKKTDIAAHALEELSRSSVKRVHMVGRRGPLQVAFTIAELREMVKLPGIRPVFDKADFETMGQSLNEIPRARKRLSELLVKTAMGEPSTEDAASWAKAEREWHLNFLRSPKEFIADKSGSRVDGVRMTVNKLEGEPGGRQKAVPTEETVDLHCGLVLRSIGYKSICIDPDIPFDKNQGIVPNTAGRVDGQLGLYCSGWLKTGPVGVITSTMNTAFDTGKSVVSDLSSGDLSVSSEQQGREAALQLLNEKGVDVVTFEEWQKIDRAEVERGKAQGKLREKIVNVEDMLEVAKS